MNNWNKENRIEHLNYLIKVSKMNLLYRKNLYNIKNELIIQGKLENEATKVYKLSIAENDDIKQIVDILVKNEEGRLNTLLLELEQLT